MATDRATAALVPIEVHWRLQIKREIKVIANTVLPTLIDTIHFLSPLKLSFTTSHNVVNIYYQNASSDVYNL